MTVMGEREEAENGSQFLQNCLEKLKIFITLTPIFVGIFEIFVFG